MFQRVALLVVAASFLALSLCMAPTAVRAQNDPSWLQPVEPFQLADNLYFVGSRGISAYLFVGSQGHVLLDSGLAENAPLVRESIEKLGFELSDVKIMISSHAHFDHVAGHAALKELTGASVFALGDDAQALRSGTDRSALAGAGWAPVEVARVLADGDVVQLGDLSLTAHHTPGHTPGCTTWTARLPLGGELRDAVFVGGTSINDGVRLVGNERHPGIAADYARTFEVLKGLKAEFFFAQHPQIFGLDAKLERLRGGEKPSPFLDAAGYQSFVAAQERSFSEQLRAEQNPRE